VFFYATLQQCLWEHNIEIGLREKGSGGMDYIDCFTSGHWELLVQLSA
jgi:hypothetical protein